MRFLADMGGDIRVVEWLREQGHEALHMREHGMHRASDEAIFAKAMACWFRQVRFGRTRGMCFARFKNHAGPWVGAIPLWSMTF